MAAGPVPAIYLEPERRNRLVLIASSYRRLLGTDLVEADGDVVEALWRAPRAILAHGTEPDPILFFGNAYALHAFETDVEKLLTMPSRLTAEAQLREERQALLDRVTQRGFIDDYSGVRITATGRRFNIEHAVVWNLVDEAGDKQGQAATFVL